MNSIIVPRNNISILAHKNAKIVLNSNVETKVIYAESKDNIAIDGGYWDSYSGFTGTSSSIPPHHACRSAMSFFRCTRLSVRNCMVKCCVSTFAIQPVSCSNMIIDNIYFEVY